MSTSESSFTVEEQLCFALYDASRAVMNRYRAGLADLGLTYTQYVVLLALWSGPTMTVSRLGERLNLDSGTLSPLLKRLESQGLVRRERSDRDERVVQVFLTEAGAALRDDAHGVQCEVETATGLDDVSVARLREELHELSARLRNHQA